MPITEKEMETVKEIVLNGARGHFPPPVQFHDANLAVRLDAEDQDTSESSYCIRHPTRSSTGT